MQESNTQFYSYFDYLFWYDSLYMMLALYSSRCVKRYLHSDAKDDAKFKTVKNIPVQFVVSHDETVLSPS